MVQQAVEGNLETPLVSPTDRMSESELWDTPYEGEELDEPDAGDDASPTPEADDDDSQEDGGESGEDESADEQPAPPSPQEAAQRRAEWVRAVALDPSAITQVPRRQRKAIIAAAEVVGPTALNMARDLAPRLAEQRYWQMIALHDKVEELDEIAEGDPQQFRQILTSPEQHGFNEEAVAQWRRVQQFRAGGNGNGNGAPPPPPQEQRQPNLDPTVKEWADRSTVALYELRDELGQPAVDAAVAWLQEEGLAVVRTGAEAKSGYEALMQHLDSVRGRGGIPAAVQRRRRLVKADVSPGHVEVSGRATKEEMNRRIFAGSESDAWAD